jgi:hypothetical protein
VLQLLVGRSYPLGASDKSSINVIKLTAWFVIDVVLFLVYFPQVALARLWRSASGLKPPSFRRIRFQSAVKPAEL